MRILLVEADSQISMVLTSTLIQQSHVVDTATDELAGWELLQVCPYDLVILDIMLPTLDEIQFCQRLRAEHPNILIMLLTARSNTADRILGLNAGADDYVIKPFDPEEFAARVRALQRRGMNSSPSLEWGNLRLDPSSRRVTFADQVINLRPKEYALIELFLRHPQRVFSRREILDRLWSIEDELPDESTIKAHIKGIRRAFRAVGAENLIQTLYGQGYGLSPQPILSSDSPPAEQTQAIVAGIWQQVKGLSFERLIVIQQAITALQAGALSEALRFNAIQSAHQLAGALGIFGFSAGSQLAKQLERELETADLTQLEAIQNIEAAFHALRQSLRVQEEIQQTQTQHPDILASSPVPLAIEIQARVLAIDDDEAMLLLLSEVLRPTGIEVIPLPAPVNLWQTLQEVQPDLVLLDVRLPNITGLEICRTIRASEEWRWLPIIFLTICADFKTQCESFELGADDYLTKPIVPSVLATRILNRIARSQTIQHYAATFAYSGSHAS